MPADFQFVIRNTHSIMIASIISIIVWIFLVNAECCSRNWVHTHNYNQRHCILIIKSLVIVIFRLFLLFSSLFSLLLSIRAIFIDLITLTIPFYPWWAPYVGETPKCMRNSGACGRRNFILFRALNGKWNHSRLVYNFFFINFFIYIFDIFFPIIFLFVIRSNLNWDIVIINGTDLVLYEE